jgi:small-conductance mechanosensitive channel
MTNNKHRWGILFAILVVVGLTFVFLLTSNSGCLKYEHPEGYVQSIDPASYKEYDVNVPSMIKKYELITIDAVKFKQHADTGKMEINLVGENFVLDMEPGIWVNEGINESINYENGTTAKRKMEPIYQYNGKVENQSLSRVCFTLDNQIVLGWIAADGEQYIIEQIGWVMDNETKRTVYVAYKESDIKHTNHYVLNDYYKDRFLMFTMSNWDAYPHTVVVEIFDSSGILIFIDEYTLEPGQFMKSPSVTKKIEDGDRYVYKATLENGMVETYNFTVDSYAAASIDLSNKSEGSGAYIEFGYTID